MSRTHQPEGARVPSEPPLDEPLALSRVDHDRELLREIVGLFEQDAGRLLRDIDAAVSAADAPAIMRLAHRMKGAVSTFAAGPATAAALRLEDIGRDGDLTEAAEAASRLRMEVERLGPALQALLRRDDIG